MHFGQVHKSFSKAQVPSKCQLLTMEFKNVLAIIFCGFSIAHSFALYPLNDKVDGRILGGIEAPDHAHPYQVSLQRSSHTCGGSIIADKFILTAAHCVDSAPPSAMRVLAGTNSASNNNGEGDGVWVGCERFFISEQFNRTTMFADIALIKLSEPLPLNDLNIKTIDLPESDHQDPKIMSVTGWGYTSNGAWTIPDRLQQIKLPTITIEDCRQTMAEAGASWIITDSHICTLHDKLDHGVCNGDSGGPLVYNATVRGVVSWGFPCARGRPDAFTRVYPFVDWIKKTVAENSS